MNPKATRFLLTISMVMAGCSTETGPRPGTPAFFWSAALETFAASDYIKTREHLEKVLAGENEYTARALPWLLILTSGTIRGYLDVADSLEAGVRAKKGDPSSFRKYISNYRSSAGRLTLSFAEEFGRFEKGKDDPVPLAFGYPNGSGAPLPELTRAAEGAALQPSDIEGAQRKAVARAVLLEACRAVGAPGDTAKAGELFKAGNVQAPRSTFLAAMADSLYEQSQLYTSRKLDNAEKLKAFLTMAAGALKGETPETKELSAKIQKAQKALKK